METRMRYPSRNAGWQGTRNNQLLCKGACLVHVSEKIIISSQEVSEDVELLQKNGGGNYCSSTLDVCHLTYLLFILVSKKKRSSPASQAG
jgi:hypothetical protein